MTRSRTHASEIQTNTVDQRASFVELKCLCQPADVATAVETERDGGDTLTRRKMTALPEKKKIVMDLGD